jgi:hypothetical protein
MHVKAKLPVFQNFFIQEGHFLYLQFFLHCAIWEKWGGANG